MTSTALVPYTGALWLPSGGGAGRQWLGGRGFGYRLGNVRKIHRSRAYQAQQMAATVAEARHLANRRLAYIGLGVGASVGAAALVGYGTRRMQLNHIRHRKTGPRLTTAQRQRAAAKRRRVRGRFA